MEWTRLWRVLCASLALAACSGESVLGGDGGGIDATVDIPPTCTGTQTACVGRCVDTQTDTANCGACGNACGPLMLCVAGACQIGCPGGGTACNGTCVNTQTDNANCGACGNACPAGTVCSMGRCGLTCAASLATCAGGADAGADGGAAGYCADTRTDRLNCGACGNACPAGQICLDRSCQLNCATGQTACGDACTDTRTDRANCGACGNACPAGAVCSAGSCGATCAPPLTTCGAGATAYCTNTTNDPANCGACGVTCTLTGVATHGCAAGACTVIRCGEGLGDCNGAAADGCETNLRTSAESCGACGRACALPHATSTCTAGACAVVSCATGFRDCDGDASNGCEVNTQTDNANCGACGTACAAGTVCSAGACGATCASTLATCGTGATAYCANTSTDPANCGACGAACSLTNAASSVCASGACVVGRCAMGFGDCDNVSSNGCEANLLTSATDCGVCGRVCATGQTCVAGACACPTGQTLCGGACVDTATSNAHCGGCGRTCALPNASASSCAAGMCAVTTCAAGFADCDRDPANGCEVNVRTDNTNCGGCGTTCAAGTVCSGGVCGTTCASPLTTCGTGASAFCANTSIDPANCGRCGGACALANTASSGCASGACTVAACVAGFGNCNSVASDGCETNTQTSAAHCGSCGRACALPNATSTCTAGACAVVSCASGFSNCDGAAGNGCEVDTRTDNANCGACGRACAAGQVCAGGVCGTTCASPLTTCGTGASAYCANTSTDPVNCGACGRSCTLPNTATNGCAGGSCAVVSCVSGFGDCNAVASDGCETNTQTSAGNCGACGRACALPNASSTCAAGACAVSACTGAFRNCNGAAADGCEVNTQTDNANCGACGNVCSSGTICSAGACVATCLSPNSLCGSGASAYCANLSSDPNNCRACGTVCPTRANASSVCSTGTCAFLCTGTFADCNGMAADGCEVDTQSSTANCGVCGRACSGAQICRAGACVVPSETIAFPIATDTLTSRFPNQWNAGDQVVGVRTSAVPSVTRAALHLTISSNVLSCDTQDTQLLVNDIAVGSFSIRAGDSAVDVSFTFSSIAGTTYRFKLLTTRTVSGGCGSAQWGTSGSTITITQ